MDTIEECWTKIFDTYNIMKQIEQDGKFIIKASEIKKFKEPRLMAKFDHHFNLPSIFKKNNLSILPVSRGSYIIAPFITYNKFGSNTGIAKNISIPGYMQSFKLDNIVNEAMALNCAYSCGILNDFLEDEDLFPTVSGRMGSGKFEFTIDTQNGKQTISVDKSQIEIDAAYEGLRYLSLFEAKNDIYEDFLIRQLYYPYRTWLNKVEKEIKSVFLIYTNGYFSLYQYRFKEPYNYNSIELVKQANYQISTSITLKDIQDILRFTKVEQEPEVPFPQADSMPRILDLIESLAKEPMLKDSITRKYAFDPRQTNYYTDAGRYLGLIAKGKDRNRSIIFSLSPLGKEISSLSYRDKQVAIAKQILKHQVFRSVLELHLKTGQVPDRKKVIQIMKEHHLYKIDSNDTYNRRASSITGWVNWILSLINED